jgi:hypothetical protein
LADGHVRLLAAPANGLLGLEAIVVMKVFLIAT